MNNLRVIETPKMCGYCGSEMTRKRFNGRLEDLGVWNRRKYCNRSCGNSKKVVGESGYRWRARKFVKTECEACGFEEDLQAHHVDQDYTNNTDENIQTLCKSCHDFWHVLAKRVGRKIAGRMPKINGTWTEI